MSVNNSFRLIGTVLNPFKKIKHGIKTVYFTTIEIQNGELVQCIPLLFYEKSNYEKSTRNKTDYSRNLTGVQVVAEGYIQSKKSSKNIILFLIVNSFIIISKGINNLEEIEVKGNIVDEEIPF